MAAWARPGRPRVSSRTRERSREGIERRLYMMGRTLPSSPGKRKRAGCQYAPRTPSLAASGHLQGQLLTGLEQGVDAVPCLQLLDLDPEAPGDAVERITGLDGVGAPGRRGLGSGGERGVALGHDQRLADIDQVAIQLVGPAQGLDTGTVPTGDL